MMKPSSCVIYLISHKGLGFTGDMNGPPWDCIEHRRWYIEILVQKWDVWTL